MRWTVVRMAVEALIAMGLAIALLWLLGCQQVVSDATDPEDLASIAEAYCLAHPELPCGHVFVCPDLGEVCILHDTPMPDGCVPTERHEGLCWWTCGEGKGCNALMGCWGCP